MSAIPRFAAAVAALLVSGQSAAASTHAPTLSFPSEAAEVSAASRLLSAYGVVTSTFRTVAHNRAVGGVPNSYHLLDRAIDISRRPGVTHQQIDAALRGAGYSLVESLDERDHSHFAFAALSSAPAPSAAASTAPAPTPKPLPRVAADEHGTLNIDIETQSAASASAAATPR